MTRTFAKMVRRAGLPHLRLYNLHHSHATLPLKAGVHPKVVSERLGHTNIGITMDIYSHVMPGMQEAAVERFDRILEPDADENSDPNVSIMSANADGVETRPCRARICDTLIKRCRHIIPPSKE